MTCLDPQCDRLRTAVAHMLARHRSRDPRTAPTLIADRTGRQAVALILDVGAGTTDHARRDLTRVLDALDALDHSDDWTRP